MIVRARKLFWRCRLADAAFPLIIGALSAFLVLDAANFGVTEVERFVYAIVYASLVVGVVIALAGASVDERIWLAIALWLLVAALLLLPSTMQRFVYPTYIVGDMASFMMPALFLLIGSRVPQLFSETALSVLALASIAAAIVALTLGVSSGRFEPPATLLVTVAWWMIHKNSGLTRVVALGVTAATLFLIIGSGQRTALLVWLLGGVWLVMMRARKPLGLVAVVVVVFAVGLLVTTTAVRSVVEKELGGYRVATLTAGSDDDSLMARVYEADDVLRTFVIEGSVTNLILGFGHGATYRPSRSNISRNITSDGRVHNIHIGPIMLVFRYGLVGLAVFLGLVFVVTAALFGRSNRFVPHKIGGAFPLIMAGYITEGLMFNVFVDPLVSYTIAGLFANFLYRPEF